MPASRSDPTRVVAVVLATVLSVGLLAGCSGDDDQGADVGPQPVKRTALSEFDTSGIAIARADFCDLIPETAAEQALGAKVAATQHYGNGEPASIAPDVNDVSHEFSCGYTAEDGTSARAWVFAPRVTEARAKALVRSTGRAKGCQTPSGPAFGSPTVATVCTTDGRVEAAYRGLFVDAWLTCSVSLPVNKTSTDALLERAGQWCVQVATAANTTRS